MCRDAARREAASKGVITAGKRTALEAMIAARQAEAKAQAERAERVAATVSGDGKALRSQGPRAPPGVQSAGFSPSLENQQLSGSCCVSYRTASL